MRSIRRFIRWLFDSIPYRSNRSAAREWLKGYELGQRQLGIARDRHGRFTRFHT